MRLSIKELEKEIRRHNRLYFVEHRPTVSDHEFDQLVEELRRRRPNSPVLSEIGSDMESGAFGKVRHETPMLSLTKAYDEKAMGSWAEKFEGDVVASPKIDGCAVSIKYDPYGHLVQGATRGTGMAGEDITENIRFVNAIPQKTRLKNVEVRGEVYMPLSVFKRYKSEFANPRNLAAGAIKQKDPNKTGEYSLSFWAYDLLMTDSKTEADKRKLLKENRFPVVEWRLIKKGEIQTVFEEYLKREDDLDYEIDGVVYKVNLVGEQERLGNTAHHPRFAIAYKFQGDSGVTVLRDVEWSVARTGVVTPVGVVDPVELSGATVTRASLHNYGLMKKLRLSRGARVLMMRRGGVIPNIESVVEGGRGEIAMPKKCPSCGSALELKEDFLYCTNSKGCGSTKISELKHFVQTVEIDGFGDVLLEKLYVTGLVTDPSKFYTLTEKDLEPLERVGDVLASKLVRNIQMKREIPMDIFLMALGISECGRHASGIMAREYDTLEKVMKATKEELSAIHTIGDVIAGNIVEGLGLKRSLIEKLLKYVKVLPVRNKKVVADGPFLGKSVLFTGSLSSMERRGAQKLVEEHGGTIAVGVSKNLDYLVVGEGGGSKLAKTSRLVSEGAKAKIIDEKEFLKLIEK